MDDPVFCGANGLLHQFVETFKETTEPLERLLKATLEAQVSWSPGDLELWLQPYLNSFCIHSEQMCETAASMAASTNDPFCEDTIQSCINHQVELVQELETTIGTCVRDSLLMTGSNQIKALRDEWTLNLKVMLDTLDDLVEPMAFIKVSELTLFEYIYKQKDSMHMGNTEILAHTRAICGLAGRLVKMALRQMDQSINVIYRGWIKRYISNLESATADIKKTTVSVLYERNESTRHIELHKHCDNMIKCVTNVKEALEGQVPPDLELLANQKTTPVKVKVTGQQTVPYSQVKVIVTDEVLDDPKDNEKQKKTKNVVPKKMNVQKFSIERTDSCLVSLGRDLIQGALAGDKKILATLSTVILARTNQAVEGATVIGSCQAEKKVIFQGMASQLSTKSAQLIELARKVAECDVSQVEPLHEACDEWVRQVSQAEHQIDQYIHKWRAVCDTLIDAKRVSNSRLVEAEAKYLHECKQCIGDLLQCARQFIPEQWFEWRARVSGLREIMLELDDLTTKMAAPTQPETSSGTNKETSTQVQQSRAWSVKAYQITTTLDRLSCLSVEEIVGLTCSYPWQDKLELRKHLSRLTEETMRAKDMVAMVLKSLTDSGVVRRAEKGMNSLDGLRGEMEDQANIVLHSTTLCTADKLMALHRMCLKQWQWVHHVQVLMRLVDTVVYDINLDFKSSTEGLENQYKKLQDRIGDSLLRVPDMTLRLHLTDLMEESKSVLQQITSVTESSLTTDHMKDRLRRQLLCKLHTLLHQLEPHVEQQIITDLRRAGPSGQVAAQSSEAIQKTLVPDGKGGFKEVPVSNLQGESMTGHSASREPGTGSKKQVNLKHSYTPEMPKKSSPPPGKKYEELKSKPKVQHKTPEKPSPLSGFKRPNKNLPAAAKMGNIRWDDKSNSLACIPRKIAQQMRHLQDYMRGRGPFQTQAEFIQGSKVITECAKEMVEFTKKLANICTDKRTSADLKSHSDYTISIATQLAVLTEVKSSAQKDQTAEKMILKNASQLTQAISRLLSAAETICVKGFNEKPAEGTEEADTFSLASQWKLKLIRHRQMETNKAPLDELGLRQVDRRIKGPSLTHLIDM